MEDKARARARILLVDDSQLNLDILAETLLEQYEVYTASNGLQAIKQTKELKPDLIILDIMMPDIDGIEVYKRLKEDRRLGEIPVIFVTAIDDIACKVKLLELGAADYITKPYNIEEIKARILVHMRQTMKNHSLQENIEKLVMNMNARQDEIRLISDKFKATVINMMIAKSRETGSHLVRTKFYLAALAEGYREKFSIAINESIVEAAVMHDIGKIGIPDNILMKPGKLTNEEYEIMKKHTTIGRDLLASGDNIILEGELLQYAQEIAYAHHERWDGTGYPCGIKENEIPLAARMMSLADVYDALVSDRVYRKAMSSQEAARIIKEERGKAFDPVLVDIFTKKRLTFEMITQKYKDEVKG